MRAHLITVHDPIRPAYRRETATVTRRRRIRALAPRGSRPFICLLNGRPLLRAGWRQRVRDGDVVVFAVLPGKGGGSNPLAVVLSLGVLIAAPFAASALAPLLGITSTAGISALAAGIAFAGFSVVNILLPPPRPSVSQLAEIAGPSPTFSLQSQGNQARLGSPIPALYGRHITFPDFAAQPFTEFAGNEQFLFQLFVIGQGEYQIESIRIEDTVVQADPIQDGAVHDAAGGFDDVSYQIVFNAPVTLFPQVVTNSVEVSGQEALTGVPIGPFVASAAGTVADHIAVDTVAPRGLFAVNPSTGALLALSMTFQTEARAIDDAGVPVGAWTVLGTETVTAATTTPQRYSVRYPVAPARYEVRLTRTDTKNTSSNAGHDLLWSGLRALHPGVIDYGPITMLALRMRASNQLSQQSARRINVIATRKLPVWNGAAWSSPQPTRSIAWAIADILRAPYGAGLPDARIDLAGLLALDAVWTARMDYYDTVVDTQQTIWESLTQAARAGRALPYLQGGIVHIVRDSAQSAPVQLYSLRNIVRGSLSIAYTMPSEESADAVDVEYFDSQTWSLKSVRAALIGSTAQQPATVRLSGVTQRDQAWREGMYMAAANRFRRRHATFETEMEGFLPALGDLIAISHDMPQWGQSGEAVAWDAATLTLTTSEPLTWGAGTHFMALRRRNGSVSGPYQVTQGPLPDRVIFSVEPDITPDVGGERERTHYSFGEGQTLHILARVATIRPRAPERVQILAVIESDAVHTADTGVAPGPAAWQLPTDFTVPVVAGLFVRSNPNDAFEARLTWQPAPGADRYLVESAFGTDIFDPTLTWTRVGETSTTNMAVRAIYGPQTIFRVAAEGATRGPWTALFFGSSSDFMWTDDAALMWTVDTNLMWS